MSSETPKPIPQEKPSKLRVLWTWAARQDWWLKLALFVERLIYWLRRWLDSDL